MATNYYTKKFNNTTQLSEFLNFGAAGLIESGTGYVLSNVFTASTATNYSDFEDINGAGLNLSGYLFISGMTAGEQFTQFATSDVTGANTIGKTLTNIGSASSPVNYRIYNGVGTFPSAGSIDGIYPIDGGFVLIWTVAAPIYF